MDWYVVRVNLVEGQLREIFFQVQQLHMVALQANIMNWWSRYPVIYQNWFLIQLVAHKQKILHILLIQTQYMKKSQWNEWEYNIPSIAPLAPENHGSVEIHKSLF